MGEILPIPWGVTVLGRWNKSILTPMYIAQKLLGHGENDPLEVQVALNVAAAVRIREKDVSVSVEDERLFIEVEGKNFEGVERARRIAAAAINALPVTPLVAAGVTLTFDLADVLSGPPSGTNKKWDMAIQSRGYEILRHISARVIKWGDARMFVHADREDNAGGQVIVNFELKSTEASKLEDWLKTPFAEFKSRTDDMLDCLKKGGIS